MSIIERIEMSRNGKDDNRSSEVVGPLVDRIEAIGYLRIGKRMFGNICTLVEPHSIVKRRKLYSLPALYEAKKEIESKRLARRVTAGRSSNSSATGLFSEVSNPYNDGEVVADSLDQYLNEIGNIPLLTPKREIHLASYILFGKLVIRGLETVNNLELLTEAQTAGVEQKLRDKRYNRLLRADTDNSQAVGKKKIVLKQKNGQQVELLSVFELRQRYTEWLITSLLAVKEIEKPNLREVAIGEILDNEINILEQAGSAYEDFICANLRLVVGVAKKYQNRGLSINDLIQEGNSGLMKAVLEFDYRKGI
ncbi:hypothetical protein A2164_03645 [Candidatus Curtissbacteria bacterium RBG_13_35_7]|uniref:RNA polymerase sigma-70 region 2 domain-containing protein n=1 Tax=Candidatus Curtissbacteria bacterium RBG_13_35_7 TaxID=1797705 RepID=A0A1F5G3L9_9BACT|nr:MAG: hypothetical protein A2164_03645 [Candidatus Curtissbacteria bacterium RBG_13_35_7]